MASGWTSRGSNPGRGRGLPFSPERPGQLWSPPTLILNGYPVVKRPGREVDRLPPSSAEVVSEWSYTYTPPICLNGV